MPVVEDIGPDSETVDSQPKEQSGPEEKDPIAALVGSKQNPEVEDDDDDEDIDETLTERLMALSEIFPEGLRNFTSGVVSLSWGSTKWLWSKGRTVTWVVMTSGIILALPAMFESERATEEASAMQQQRQILLGPGAAGGPGPGMMPGMMPPQAAQR